MLKYLFIEITGVCVIHLKRAKMKTERKKWKMKNSVSKFTVYHFPENLCADCREAKICKVYKRKVQAIYRKKHNALRRKKKTFLEKKWR